MQMQIIGRTVYMYIHLFIYTFVWYFWDISFITRILMFEHDTNSLFTFMQKFLKRYKGTLLSSEVSSGEFQLQYLALLCMAVIKSFSRKEEKIKDCSPKCFEAES